MSQLFLKTKTAGYFMVQNMNQLLYSQLFSNAVWVKTNATLTAGQTDPSAGTEAFNMTAGAANATVLQSLTLDTALNRTFSLYLKRVSGTGAVSLTADGTNYTVKSITSSWVRYDITDVDSGTVQVGVKLATSGDVVAICWAQFEDGDISTYATNVANRYTVTQIVDADYPANTARGCAFLDGRFFVMTPKGEIYQSALEDASTWDALEFIQSQIESDAGVYLAKYQNYLVTLKDWSTEFFYDAANPTGSILAPVQNAAFQIGCAHENSVKEMAGTVVWMGHTREGVGRAIFTLSGTSPQKLSTPAVEKILDADDLAVVHSWAANVGSHLLYGLTLGTSQKTLVYDFPSQLWSFFTYLTVSGASKTVTAISTSGQVTISNHGYSDCDIVYISGTNSDFNGWHVITGVSPSSFQLGITGAAFSGSGACQKYTESYFPVSSSVRCNGKQYMQDISAGVLYEFSQDVYTDPVGAIAARIRTPKFDAGDTKFRNIAEAELIGDKVDSMATLRYTDDDFQTYSAGTPIDLGVERSRVRRLGRFSRRAFEIIHVGNALLRLEALEIEVK